MWYCLFTKSLFILPYECDRIRMPSKMVNVHESFSLFVNSDRRPNAAAICEREKGFTRKLVQVSHDCMSLSLLERSDSFIYIVLIGTIHFDGISSSSAWKLFANR